MFNINNLGGGGGGGGGSGGGGGKTHSYKIYSSLVADYHHQILKLQQQSCVQF